MTGTDLARDIGVGPSLKRLVDSPKRPGAIRLWNALTPDERQAATHAYLESDSVGRRPLNKVVAEARRFRPATVQKWTVAKIVQEMRTVPLHDPGVALRLLRCSQIPGRLPMVSAFLDAVGIRHTDGSVDSIKRLDASEDTLRSAASELVAEYGPRAVVIYVLVLRLDGAPIGEKARGWLQAHFEEPVAEAVGDEDDSVTVSLGEADPADEEEADATEDDPVRQASLTTLDRLLMKATQNSAHGIVGALDEDQIDDAVGEFVKLNSTRNKSYFHAGYRDVLFGRPIVDQLPSEAPASVRWYWAGAIRGWARRERWGQIANAFASSPVVQQLGSGSNNASAAAVCDVVEALHRENRTEEVAGFVKKRALVAAPRLFEMLLDATTNLLRAGDAANARPIFELLMQTRGTLEERGVAPPQRVLLAAHRRTAHCLRGLHEHGRSRRLLTGLLDEDPDPNVHAMVHADLGLMGGGFDALEDVALPLRQDELHGVLERLMTGKEHFRESVKAGREYSSHGHYCLGVLYLGQAGGEKEFQRAEHHLQRARMHFSEQANSYADELVRRTNLYVAVAKTLQLQYDKFANAADMITKALGAGARIPAYLINRTVEAFTLADDKSDLRRVTDAIVEAGGDAVLDELADCAAALDCCPALVDQLRSRADSKRRSGSARAADLRATLRGYMMAGDLARAGEVLDGLESLALNKVGGSEFVELLSHPDRYDPAWTPDDAAIALAHCHEAQGAYHDATSVLRDVFHRLMAKDTDTALLDAAGLLQRISRYGIERLSYSDMRVRYDAAVADVAEADDGRVADQAQRLVKVLVMGGAEQQARSEDSVRSALRTRCPHVRPTFIQTGWSSNWERPLQEFNRQVENHDALVILRFIRTNLGRRVRREWPGSRPWRFCWSGGVGAIVDAVERAAAAVR